MTTPAQEMVDLYTEAERVILEDGSSVTMNGKTWTSANLPELRKGRREWERRVAQERSGGGPGFVRFL